MGSLERKGLVTLDDGSVDITDSGRAEQYVNAQEAESRGMKRTRDAVAETASVETAKRAAGAPAPSASAGPGGADAATGEMRRSGPPRLLALHSPRASPATATSSWSASPS